MPIKSRFLPDLIDIVRAGTITGRYGDSELDWTKATVQAAVPAMVQPLSQAERFDEARDVLASMFRVATNGTDIQGYDRIVWPSATTFDAGFYDGAVTYDVPVSGSTYEVMGQPAVGTTPIGIADHTEFTMRIVEG